MINRIMTLVAILAVAFYVFMLIGGTFYVKLGWFKRFFHDVLKWHMPDEYIGFDGASYCSSCKYCHKDIIQDSQGNWF